MSEAEVIEGKKTEIPLSLRGTTEGSGDRRRHCTSLTHTYMCQQIGLQVTCRLEEIATTVQRIKCSKSKIVRINDVNSCPLVTGGLLDKIVDIRLEAP